MTASKSPPKPCHTTHLSSARACSTLSTYAVCATTCRLPHTPSQHWREAGVCGLWLKVPVTKAHLIAEALQQGFDCHHAEKDYIMLTQWLPACENRLPASASHQVGVGAFVLNEHREVLVVQEKHGPLRGAGVWKLPTGLVMQGEDVTAAAAREVLEETVC